MIISQLKGGLGNQLFQYAAGYAVAKKWQTDLKLDVLYLHNRSKRSEFFSYRNYALDYFNISAPIASNKEILSFTIPMTMNRKLHHFLCKLMFFGSSRFYEKWNVSVTECTEWVSAGLLWRVAVLRECPPARYLRGINGFPPAVAGPPIYTRRSLPPAIPSVQAGHGRPYESK